MKRLINICILLCICTNSVCAQRDYDFFKPEDYASDTLRMDGYTYVCDTLVLFKDICIYNAENHPGRSMNLNYKDGSPIKIESIDDLFFGGKPEVVLNDNTSRKLFNIIDCGFSKEQALIVFPKTLDIVLNISSSDGTITDVYFWYQQESKYTEIPLDVFRQIELSLKNEVVFELTEEGRRMNYCYLSWSQVPKGRIEIEPTPNDTSEGGGGSTGAGNTIIDGPVRNNTDIITVSGGK